MSGAACPMRRSVDAHFKGGLSPAAEHRLREHLPECDGCRDRYERRLVLSRLDPAVPGARARLGRGLGLAPRARRAAAPVLALAGALAAALLALRPGGGDDEAAGFRPRGDGSPVRLHVFAVAGGARPAGEEIAPDEELAFAVESEGPARYVLVFGTDEHGHVYWYHPAWESPQADPPAVPLPPGAGVRELPDAVRHRLDGRRLELRALFLEQPLTVRAAEALLEDGRLALPPGAREVRRTLRVRAAEAAP